MLLRCSTILVCTLLCWAGPGSAWAGAQPLQFENRESQSTAENRGTAAVSPLVTVSVPAGFATTTAAVDHRDSGASTTQPGISGAVHSPVIAAANAMDMAITLIEPSSKVPVQAPALNTAKPVTPIAPPSAKSGIAPATQPAVATQPATATPSARDKLPLGPAPVRTAGNSAAGNAKEKTDPNWLTNTLISLAAVVALIFILRGVIAKWTGRTVTSKASPVVEVLSRVTIAPKNHVLLLRMGSRILVVGDSPAGLRTLAHVRDPEEIAHLLASISAAKPQSISASFSRLLERLGHDPATIHDDGSVQIRDLGGDDSEHQLDRTRDQVSGLLSRVRTVGRQRPGGLA